MPISLTWPADRICRLPSVSADAMSRRTPHFDGTMSSTTISARDANQHFAEMLGRAAAGETVVITRRGKPVATLAPYRPERAVSPEWKAAQDRLLASLERGVTIGISEAEARAWKWNRDELYERD